jgi:hypothetical protein
MLRLKLPGWRIDRGGGRVASRIDRGGGRNGAVSNIERYDRNDKAATVAALFLSGTLAKFLQVSKPVRRRPEPKAKGHFPTQQQCCCCVIQP